MESKSNSRRVVVLGASGFLGSAMATHLASLGHEVIAYWRQPKSEVANLPNVQSVIADLRDTWILSDVIENADVVYHFASATHPSLFYANPSAEYWEALQPLLVMMETAARGKVRKIVFPSSGGTIYAASEKARTEESRLDPKSPYAIFKLAAEQLLLHADRLGQLSVDIFRIGNPYGPGQRARPGQGVLPHWIDAIQNKRPIKVFGDGSAERDYVFIEDLCRMMAVSTDRLDESGIYNLGTGKAVSLNELLGHIQSHLSEPHPVENVPGRAVDVQSIALDTEKLLSLIPDFRFTPLTDGIQRTLRHHGLA